MAYTSIKPGEEKIMSKKKQAFNPYLPSFEYVPDGEPSYEHNQPCQKSQPHQNPTDRQQQPGPLFYGHVRHSVFHLLRLPVELFQSLLLANLSQHRVLRLTEGTADILHSIGFK